MLYVFSLSIIIRLTSLFMATLSHQAVFTGGTIQRVTIDPNLGGCTLVEGGHPPSVLSAGYIGSTLLGGAFVLAGWDTLVAKIMSFFLGVGLICPLVLVRDKLYVPSIPSERW
jgi:hypothetical protein